MNNPAELLREVAKCTRDGGLYDDAEALEQAAEMVERLMRRLADCIMWMDTREWMILDRPRICEMARQALIEAQFPK